MTGSHSWASWKELQGFVNLDDIMSIVMIQFDITSLPMASWLFPHNNLQIFIKVINKLDRTFAW